jgi:hypothetical protein
MAAGAMREYDPDQYTLLIAGIPMEGYAEDEFVSVEYDTADFEDVCGVDGEVTRSKSSDNRATVTVRLMQSSPVNDLLSTLRTLDKNTPGGVGVGPFLLRDKQGSTLLMSEKCWISERPAGSWARTAKEREWKIRCASMQSHFGGS